MSRLLLHMRLRMNGMHKTQFNHARFDFSPRNLVTSVLTICHVNLTQSIALEQKPEKRLDLR